MKTLFAAVAALCLAMPALAHADDSWDQVVAAAKKEGKVTFYTSHATSPYDKEIARDFEAKYGIPVEMLAVRASELLQRTQAEQSAGRYVGDVIQSGVATLTTLRRANQLAPHGDIPGIANLLPNLKADEIYIPEYLQAYGYLINTNLIPEAEQPKSWADLTDPKWKGKMLADDPRAVGGGFVAFEVLHDVLGENFERKLAAQQPVISRNLGADEQRIAQGEYPIYFPVILSDIPQLEGLPVKAVLPTEGVAYVPFFGAMLKNAPHPNAARLLMDFFMSDQTQILIADQGQLPATKGVADKVTGKTASLMHLKLMGAPNPDTQDELQALAKTIWSN